MKYIISTDGHTPSKSEIESGKRQFQRERKSSPPIDQIHNWKTVVMTFTDVNYVRGWSFSEGYNEN